jgi:hypothetical protein
VLITKHKEAIVVLTTKLLANTTITIQVPETQGAANPALNVPYSA